LRKRAERVLVRLVDLLALLLEVLDRFAFLLVETLGVFVHRFFGGGLELCLLFGLHGVPDLRADRHDVIGDDVAGEHELGRYLVELHQFAGDDGIVLAVHRAGLQRGVELGVGDWRRIGAE
jgi:hypothetical protein